MLRGGGGVRKKVILYEVDEVDLESDKSVCFPYKLAICGLVFFFFVKEIF